MQPRADNLMSSTFDRMARAPPLTWRQFAVQDREDVGTTISEDAHREPGCHRGAEVFTLFQLCRVNLLWPEYFILGLSMTADDRADHTPGRGGD
jgi:hypothetical protein